MSHVTIAELEIGPRLLDRLWLRGLDGRRIESALYRRFVVLPTAPNKEKARTILGRDERGEWIALLVAPTREPFAWRLVSGWYCRLPFARLSRALGITMKSIKGVRFESTVEPYDDMERELMDPDGWDWDHPIEGKIAEDVGIVLRIEFLFGQFGLVERAARGLGLPPHEFVLQSVLAAARAAESSSGEPNVESQEQKG